MCTVGTVILLFLFRIKSGSSDSLLHSVCFMVLSGTSANVGSLVNSESSMDGVRLDRAEVLLLGAAPRRDPLALLRFFKTAAADAPSRSISSLSRPRFFVYIQTPGDVRVTCSGEEGNSCLLVIFFEVEKIL